jgi:hypothetical protein
MFSSFCSATFNVARNFLRWSHVANNLWALSCKAQKTILFLTILAIWHPDVGAKKLEAMDKKSTGAPNFRLLA